MSLIYPVKKESMAVNIYLENQFDCVRCVYAAHVQSYSSSHRLATENIERPLFDLVSDNMIPTSLMRAVSKTPTCSLISHLHPSTLSASLSTTSPATSLVQAEVDSKGIATVSKSSFETP